MSEILESQDNTAVIARMEIQRSLGRVEGKIDQIISGMDNHELRDNSRFEEVNRRIILLADRQRSMEKKIWYASGVVGVLMFALAHFPFNMFFK